MPARKKNGGVLENVIARGYMYRYCDSSGDYRRSLADFKQALTAAGYETRKTKAGAFVYGLRVSENVDEYGPPPWQELPEMAG